MHRRTVLGLAALSIITPCPVLAFFKKKPKVTLHPDFSPQNYDQLGVVVESSNRSMSAENLQVVEDAFVGVLLGKGYLVSAAEDVRGLRNSSRSRQGGNLLEIARHSSAGELFKAVVGVTVGSITFSRKEALVYIGNDRYMTVCDVTLSVRMLAAGDGQILATGSHSVSEVVAARNDAAPALQVAATQLAEALPGLFVVPEPERRRR